MSAREVAAKALREYFAGVGQQHLGSADAVLNALKANGYAVVELPKPCTEGGTKVWWTQDVGEVGLRDGGDVDIVNVGYWLSVTPTEARDFGACLIAAAAERDSEER